MPKKWSFLREDPITGKRYFKLEIIEAPKLVEPPSLTELPPPGLEGVPLTKEKPIQPVTIGGRERGRIFSHAQASAEAMGATEERLEGVRETLTPNSNSETES